MTIEKKYSVTNGKQLWRIKIGDDSHLYVETRDKEKKEAYFACYFLDSGEKVFENYQFEEKFWIGIEDIYKGIIFLHKYPKPDMPAHNEIIAFDAASQKILWTNHDYAFYFVKDDLVYGKKETFGNAELAAFDYLSGKKTEIDSDNSEIASLAVSANSSADYSEYAFPEEISAFPEERRKIEELLAENLSGKEYTGNIECTLKNGAVFISVHTKNETGKMDCRLFVNDFVSGNKLLDEIVNRNMELFAADTFFIYKNLLFVLKDQKQLDVYLISE